MRTRASAWSCLVLALAAVSAARADVLRVGPDGGYDTIQEALTAAARLPLSPTSNRHEIRVQQGTYRENIRVPNPCCGGRIILVIGGWDATFFDGSSDPRVTVIDGRGLGRVVNAPNLTSGSLSFDNMTLRGGVVRAGGSYGIGTGAGVRASVSGTAGLSLARVHVINNVIRADLPGAAEAQGAGAAIVIQEDARLVVTDSLFITNSTVQSGSTLAAAGGGLHLQVGDRARAAVRRSEFRGNSAFGSGTSTGGGLLAMVDGASGLGLTAEDLVFHGNIVQGANGEGTAATLRAFNGDGTTMIQARRLRIFKNIVGRSQLYASASSGARVDVTDSLVANGRGGLRAFSTGGDLRLSNLTVARNQQGGLQGSVAAGGRMSAFNTIAFGNTGVDLRLVGEGTTTGWNLVGIDPLFVDAQSDDFTLDGASLAIDAGTASPPAGLGPVDLARFPRVVNGAVDIGAYEWDPSW
jgi:hypothetical protein